MSSFRLICIAAFTAAMVVFVADTAAAQSTTGQAGKAYLAGLRPPHEHPKAAHVKTTRLASPRKPTAKTAQQTTKPTVTAKSKTHHRPVRLADKINSRVAWPSVEPSAADQPATTESALQFATEDATSTSATSATPASAPAPSVRATSAAGAASHLPTPAPAASAAKTAPSVNIAASDQHDSADPIAADKPQTVTTGVQTERFEAPAPRQMRVIVPALSEAPATASTASDPSPPGGSTMAQMLATLAGALAACIAAFLISGFWSGRIRQI